jgi:hypothetical protein
MDFKAKAETPEIFQERAMCTDFGLHHPRFREFVRARRCDEKLPQFARGIVPE